MDSSSQPSDKTRVSKNRNTAAGLNVIYKKWIVYCSAPGRSADCSCLQGFITNRMFNLLINKTDQRYVAQAKPFSSIFVILSLIKRVSSTCRCQASIREVDSCCAEFLPLLMIWGAGRRVTMKN